MLKKSRVAVPVATVWTGPDSVRSVDMPVCAAEPDLVQWLSEMTQEQNMALCREKRLQTQALFGDEVYVDEVQGDWSKIVIPSQSSSKDPRGYPGWVPSVQLSDTACYSRTEETVMIQSIFAPFRRIGRTSLLRLSFGTFLPLKDAGSDEVKVSTPLGDGLLRRADVRFCSQNSRLSGNQIVKNAERFMQLPYLWAGISAYGYDCSGFSYSMLRAGGYIIPRDAADQSVCGTLLSPEQAGPGDLLFFADKRGRGKVHHVGICAGDGKMIHSPSPGERISLTELAGTLYQQELCAVRRFWKEGEQAE